MKVYFSRHGESLANTLHVISNRNIPYPLTKKGRNQSKMLASSLMGKGITHIFSSPVLRAKETAKIVSDKLDVSVETCDALREYDCGELEGHSDEKAWKIHEEYIVDWLAGSRRAKSPPGGESFNTILDRFVPFVEDLIRKFDSSDENLLLISHGGMLLLGLPHVLTNVDFIRARSLSLDNTILILAETAEGKLVCKSWGDILIP